MKTEWMKVVGMACSLWFAMVGAGVAADPDPAAGERARQRTAVEQAQQRAADKATVEETTPAPNSTLTRDKAVEIARRFMRQRGSGGELAVGLVKFIDPGQGKKRYWLVRFPIQGTKSESLVAVYEDGSTQFIPGA